MTIASQENTSLIHGFATCQTGDALREDHVRGQSPAAEGVCESLPITRWGGVFRE